MATSGMKKPRSSNFSLNDCLVLAEVMGEESSVEGLSFHAYLKHRFTNTITSTSKREKWTIIASNFKARADVPRDVPSLQKKWDNLVQVHRGMYMDFMQSQRMTGGGPNQKSLTLLTEAVMDVVGRTAANTLGVAACSMDSSMLLLNQLYATTSSTSVSRETLSNTESRMVEHIETEVATAELPTDLSRQPTTMLTRFDIDDNCELLFLDKVKAIKSGSIQPYFNSDGIHFYNICRSGVYFVACSKSDVSPVLVIELLSRFYHVCKDFCGVVTEQSVQANILLIYELLDELLNEGYVQLATTEKLRPYIQSEPVIILKERSPTNEMSSRVFGIETKVLPGSVAQMPVVQSSNESDARRNELFVDVVEKMVAVINKDGTVSRMEVNGSMNIKNFLTGCPQIKMALNEDLVISGGAQKGYGNQVQIDRCSFHKSVQQTDFASTRVLVLNPPIGEFSVMAYNVSGEMSLNQPFRLMTFIGDTDGSRDMLVTLRLHCDIPSRTDAVNVRLKLPVPAGVSSVSTKLGSDAQSTEFTESEKQIIWFIKKLPGKTEAMAQFRLISQGSGTINRYEVGPIALEFEISGYTSSGLQLRYVKIQGAEKSQSRQQWIRHITVSDSYIFRT